MGSLYRSPRFARLEGGKRKGQPGANGRTRRRRRALGKTSGDRRGRALPNQINGSISDIRYFAIIMSFVVIGGGYWTGSSALIDLLREHRGCFVVPGEFRLLSNGVFFKDINNIQNGEHNSSKFLSRHINYIRRCNDPDYFKINALSARICEELRWYPGLLFPRRRNWGKKYGKKYRFLTDRLVRLLSKNRKEVLNIDKIKGIIKSILYEVATHVGYEGGKIVVFDQLSNAFHTDYTAKLLEDAKFINVDRYWMDQYVEVKDKIKQITHRKHSLGLNPFDGMSISNIKNRKDLFIKMRTRLNRKRDDQKKHKRIKWVDFENIVNNKIQTARSIFKYLRLGLDEWCEKGKYFDSQSSKRNIGQWKECEPTEISYISGKIT